MTRSGWELRARHLWQQSILRLAECRHSNSIDFAISSDRWAFRSEASIDRGT
jgi:hypothetical protein